MGQKTSQLRGIHAALAAAGANIHPSLTPGSALWLWALAAAVLFGGSSVRPAVRPAEEVQS